jgi:hypothetical protein
MRKIIFLLFTAISSVFGSNCYTQNDVLNSDNLFSYENNVYDITGYKHPSGKTDLLKTVSVDASIFFEQSKYKFHKKSSRVSKDLKKMLVGVLKNNCTEISTTITPPTQITNITDVSTTFTTPTQTTNITETTKKSKKTTFPKTKKHKTTTTPPSTSPNITYIPTITCFNTTTFPIINTTTSITTTSIITTEPPIINVGLSLTSNTSNILLIFVIILSLSF